MKITPRISRTGGVVIVLGLILVGLTYWFTALRPAMGGPHTRLSRSGQLEVTHRPAPLLMLRDRGKLEQLPVYDAKSARNWQVDLRGRDVSALDLRERAADLRYADFDHGTRWPQQLPGDFNPDAILTLNKNPGLGVRALHAQGLTGTGVGIGIIDQTLLVEHEEYRERLRSYEEIHSYGTQAQMHGPAVASIAVGKSVGVAPGADLYYIAETAGTYDREHKFQRDFGWLAKSIDRLLEISATLPAGRRIRVISVSVGWSPKETGYAETMEAVKRATAAGVFVVSTALERTHGLSFHGLGRHPMSDPDWPESYRPGIWWEERFWTGQRFAPGQRLLVPMDSRTTASPTGADAFVYYVQGGWSWSVPWIAGLYALACQLRPDITPELFWAEALRSGRTIRIKWEGQEAEFGTIADPAGLMKRLQPESGRLAGS